MCDYNRNTHNGAFCIFSCKTLNNFYKLLFITVICNEKQKHWPYKQYYVETSRYFYRKLYYHNFFECRKNWRRAGIQIWQILEDHVLEMMRWYKGNIVTTSALDFKQLYIIYKFYPIKRLFISEKTPYFAQTFNYWSRT